MTTACAPVSPSIPTSKIIVGFDTETHRISAAHLAPPLVCLSHALRSSTDPSGITGGLDGMADETERGRALETITSILTNPDVHGVAHNLAFDLAVIVARWPDLMTLVWDKLTAGGLSCTKVREKLLNLANIGDLRLLPLPGGAKSKIEYHLYNLELKYTGKDRRAIKESPDAWRTNYAVLDGIPLEQWPEGARTYPVDDAIAPLAIWEAQELVRWQFHANTGIDPLNTENFRVTVDFALQLAACWGICTDPEKIMEFEALIREELSPEKMVLLVEKGILRKAEAPRPHGNGAKEHVEGCRKRWVETDAAGTKTTCDCDCPVKMTAGAKESMNKAALSAYVLAFAKSYPEVKLKYTDPSKTFPEGQLSTDAEWLETYEHLDPVLSLLAKRSKLDKLVNTEIPRMKNPDGSVAPIVRPQYDALLETGRTSSFASDTLPSLAIQIVQDRARPAYVPRDGHLFFSVDFSVMELVTLAQTCLNLFGQSVLADKLLAGVDPHAYLGAQLAAALDPQFREYIAAHRGMNASDVHHCFEGYKESEHPEHRKFYRHWRKFAKPTGLGYPGGLGPATFCAYAKAQFDVIVDEPTARMLRDTWKQTYPEMDLYFDHINKNMLDSRHPPRMDIDPASGKEKASKLHSYVTPFGMLRSACSYCACANGYGLQSPGAEGSLLGFVNVSRACYDPSLRSILYNGVRPIGFIHDEIMGEVRDDNLAHERVKEIGTIMSESFLAVCPDIPIKTAGVLMRRWYKEAEPVYDPAGRLIPWEPKPKATP